MPEIISQHDFQGMKGARKDARQWPNEWFDGQPRRFCQDTDFPGLRPESFINMMRLEAKRRGLKLRTVQPEPNTVIAFAVSTANEVNNA